MFLFRPSPILKHSIWSGQNGAELTTMVLTLSSENFTVGITSSQLFRSYLCSGHRSGRGKETIWRLPRSIWCNDGMPSRISGASFICCRIIAREDPEFLPWWVGNQFCERGNTRFSLPWRLPNATIILVVLPFPLSLYKVKFYVAPHSNLFFLATFFYLDHWWSSPFPSSFNFCLWPLSLTY